MSHLTVVRLRAFLNSLPPEMDNWPLLCQRLDDHSLKAGFEVLSLSFDHVDRMTVDDDVAAEIGRGVEPIVGDFLHAYSFSLIHASGVATLNIVPKFCET